MTAGQMVQTIMLDVTSDHPPRHLRRLITIKGVWTQWHRSVHPERVASDTPASPPACVETPAHIPPRSQCPVTALMRRFHGETTAGVIEADSRRGTSIDPRRPLNEARHVDRIRREY